MEASICHREDPGRRQGFSVRARGRTLSNTASATLLGSVYITLQLNSVVKTTSGTSPTMSFPASPDFPKDKSDLRHPLQKKSPTMTLNKIEKLGGLRQHRGSLPISVDSHRRGSMPLPYKHQLRRAQAVDELDWPSVHSGSSDSVRSSDSNPEPGAYKVMLVGDTGVGKTTLAGIFGGLKDTFPHEAEHPEDTYEIDLMVDGEKTTLIVYDIWEQVGPHTWMQESCLEMGDAFLLIFSVTDRSSFQHLPGLLLKLRSARPHRHIPVILVGNKGDLARSREVSMEEGRSLAGMLSCKYTETSAALHHNTQELLEGVVRQIRLRKDDVQHNPQPATLLPPGRRESLTKRARRVLQGIMGKHKGFFKQRSKSCHDLSVL